MKNIFFVMVGLLVLACVVGSVSAEYILRDYNFSTPETVNGLSGVGGNLYGNGLTGNAQIIFSRTGAISGLSDVRISPVVIKSGTSAIAGLYGYGPQSIRIAVTGAGDSYSSSRNTGTLYFTPITRMSTNGVTLSNMYMAATFEIVFDKPMVYVTGDTTTFNIRNLDDLTGTSWNSIISHMGDGVIQGCAQASSMPSTVNLAGISGYGGITPVIIGSQSSVLYGISDSSGLLSCRYNYYFENYFRIDSTTRTWTLNKVPNSSWTYPNASVKSGFNITDGTGQLTEYPSASNYTVGTYFSAPVKINLSEQSYNTVFTETFFPIALNYSVVVTPNSVTPNQTFTVSLSSLGVLPGKIMNLAYDISPYPSNTDTLKNNGSTASYVLRNSTWYQWNDASSAYDISVGGFPNNKQFTVSDPGNYTIYLTYITSDSDYAILSAPLTVTGATLKTAIFTVVDGSTGNLIAPSTLYVKNIGTMTWTNYTLSDTGKKSVSVMAGTVLGYFASATGYNISLYVYQTIRNDVSIPIYLYGPGNNTAGNISVRVAVSDEDGNVLSGTSVTLGGSSSWDQIPLRTAVITGSTGVAVFNEVPANAQTTITAKKTGYAAVSKTVTLGSSDVTISIVLPKYGVTVTSTVTGTSTTGGIVTLDVSSRNKNVVAAGDVWYTNATFLSELILFAVVITIFTMIAGGRKKK
jgi:hypothetical protein